MCCMNSRRRLTNPEFRFWIGENGSPHQNGHDFLPLGYAIQLGTVPSRHPGAARRWTRVRRTWHGEVPFIWQVLQIGSPPPHATLELV